MKTFFSLILIFVFSLEAQNLFLIDFQTDIVGNFPSNWTSKNEADMGKVYSVSAEAENKYLHGNANGLSVQIGYEREWELTEYPIIKWRWRAVELPKGSNEKKKTGNDNALGFYVVFGGWPVPRNIKYIWSETLPVGAVLESPFTSKTKMVVLRSGAEKLGEWVSEERDVLADYRKLFGDGETDPKAKGIAVLTDSDNTGTQAIGDYDDITVSVKK
jgi:hypothetical protein